MAGDCFGEMAVIGSSERSATAIADSRCVLIEIKEVILRTTSPKLCLKLYKNLSYILVEKLKKSDATINKLKDGFPEWCPLEKDGNENLEILTEVGISLTDKFGG